MKSNDTEEYLEKLENDFGYMLTYTSGYVCPGWTRLIRDMLTEIDNNLGIIRDEEDRPQFTQIKEKYGMLRVYGFNISDGQQAIIEKYERLSAVTCQECGANGKMREKSNWLYVACDEHARGGNLCTVG
jgi:hypothetical protein